MGSFIASLALIASLSAIQAATVQKACPPYVTIMGGTEPSDRTRHRCNLENKPASRITDDQLPAPVYARKVNGGLTVVVDSSGRVDVRLTRWLKHDLDDDHFYATALQMVAHFRYDIGLSAGKATRYGFVLNIAAGARADTIPQRLVWRYVRGTVDDSLVGAWRAEPNDRPLTANQTARIVKRVTDMLIEMDVLSRDVRSRRYHVGAPISTGGGRTVVRASGDVLRRWPPGLDGRPRAGWTAYCVVPATRDVRCDVAATGDSSDLQNVRPMFPASARPRTGPVSIAVEVTTRGAYRSDTVRSVIQSVPSLAERSVFRKAQLCSRGAAWTAIADRPFKDEKIVWLTLPNPKIFASAYVTNVRSPIPFGNFPCDADDEVVESEIALFTLRGLGDPLQGPVQFCLNQHGCAPEFIIRPGLHELAESPHITLKIEDLRAMALKGESLDFRVHVDRDIEGLLGFTVVRQPGDVDAWALKTRNARELDFNVTGIMPLPGTEFHIYLARRPAN